MGVGVTSRRSGVDRLLPGLVTVGGVVSSVSCLYLLFTNTSFIGGRVPETLMELLLLGVPAVGLLYSGYWLSAEGFDPEEVRGIGRVAAGGVFLATGVTCVLLVSAPPTGITTRGTFFLLVGTGSEGALIGVLLGVLRATDLFRHSESAEVDQLETINSVLRHNLRNRLTIMRSYLGFVKEGSGSSGDHIATIESQHEAILELLEDTKLASEAARNAELEAVDLRETASSQAALLESCHESADVSVSVPDGTHVWADDLLAPMLENLLFNAVAHCDRPTTSIDVVAECNGDTVALRVADDGPGIPDERKDRVFDAEVGEGTGMGLYLVRSIVSRYGGEVTITDNEPRGTRIELTLRRADVPA